MFEQGEGVEKREVRCLSMGGGGLEKREVFEQGGGGLEKREVFEQGGGVEKREVR